MATYIFRQDYSAPHRLHGTSDVRMFSAGQRVSGKIYQPNRALPSSMRMAQQILVDDAYLIPMSVIKLEPTFSSAAGANAVTLPEDKILDVKKALNEVSGGNIRAGAIIGVLGGLAIAWVTKKNMFMGAGIGMVVGGAFSYMFSRNLKSVPVALENNVKK